MRKNTILNKTIFLPTFLILLLCFTNLSYAIVLDNPKDEGKLPEYVPGEVLVKFKEGVDPQSVLSEINLQPQGIERIHSISPAVAKFKKDYKLEKDSEGWYAFLGKNYKEVNDIPDEEMFKEAYKNMPEIAKSLYRSYKISLPQGISVEEAISKLKNNPNVEYVEPNRIVRVQMVPNDPYYHSSGSWGQPYDDLWGIKKLQCEQAWDISQGEGVVVAVIDTGVDYNHEDIAENIWINEDEIPDNSIDDDGNGYIDDVKGFDFAYNDNDPMDGYGHGTHVAGAIAAVGNNSAGVIGVAPKARVMAVKAFTDNGSALLSDAAMAVIYAADNGANILNNSWGGYGTSQVLTDAFHYAHSKGCVAIAAVGNDNIDYMTLTPANIDTVIGVAASDQNDQKCDFSNWGDIVDVAAPGGGSSSGDRNNFQGRNILSLRSDNNGNPIDMYGDNTCIVADRYYRARGTSMACPHAAGVAALVMSKYPQFTNDEVRYKLENSCDDLGTPGKDQYFGSGRINAAMAVMNDNIYISFPQAGSYVHGSAEIRGSVFLDEGFQRYGIYYAPMDYPQNMTLIMSSTVPVQDGDLGTWSTAGCLDGKYILTLKIIKNNGGEITSSKGVIVDNVNEPPTFANLRNKASFLGELLRFKVIATDPDDPATPFGHLTYTVAGLPEGAQFDPENRVFSWTRPASDGHLYIVTFTVSDGEYTVTEDIKLVPMERIFIDAGFTHPWIYDSCAVYGDKVVWPKVNYEDPSANLNLYIYDLYTCEGRWISPESVFQSKPAVYGDKVAWLNYLSGSPYERRDVYVYNIPEDYTNRVTYDQSFKWNLRMYGNRIMWMERYYQGEPPFDKIVVNTDIYVYDLSTKQKKTITSDPELQLEPAAIYGDKVVWSEYVTEDVGNYQIFMYDLSTNQERIITNDGMQHIAPAIYGDKIVYLKSRESVGYSASDVYLYDLNTQQITQISNDYSGSWFPNIYGNRVIWVGYEAGYPAVYVYDLNTQETVEVSDPLNNPGEVAPIIQDDIVAWLEGNDGNYNRITINRFIFPPEITSVSYKAGAGNLTISGKYFSSYTDRNNAPQVIVNGVAATVERWSMSEIICQVSQTIQSYTLKVVAIGGESEVVEVTIPTAPSNLTATPLSSTQIKLTWLDNSLGETGFKIEQSDDGINFSQIATVAADVNAYYVTNLTTGNNYYFRVCAYKADLVSEYSNVASASLIIPPIAPTNLTAQALLPTQIRLNWQDNSLDETGFKIEQSDDGINFSQIATVAADVNAYYVTNLTTGNNYYFRVCAYKADLVSEYSNVASASLIPPIAPTNLTAQALSPTQIRLNWQDNSLDETGFIVEMSSNGVTFVYKGTASANVTAYTIVGLSANTTYYFRVYAIRGSDKSTYSEVIKGTTMPLPIAPSNLTAQAISSTQIKLTWQDNSLDETGFKIEQSDDGINFSQIAAVAANAKAYYVTNLTAGNNYYFRVCAYKADLVSEYSNVASASLIPPIAPTNLTAQALSSTQIRLNWQDNSDNEIGFRIEMSTDGGITFTYKGGTSTDKTTYTISSLIPNTTYQFRVYAYNGVGKTYSDVVSISTLPLPAAPSNLTAQTLSSTQIKLTWQDNSLDETGFRVEMSSDGVTFASKGSAGANVTTCTIVGLSANTTYYFRVYAIRGSDKSAYSEVIQGTTMPLPIAPSNLTAQAISSTQIKLTWQDNSLDETGFRVEMSSDGVTFASKGSAATNITTCTIGGLSANTTYSFRAYALRGSDKSAYSEVIQGTTIPLPIAPSLLTATLLSSTQIKLTWQDNSLDETGFRVEMSSDGVTFASKGSAATNITTCTIVGLSANTLYYFRAYAIRGSDKSGYSNVVYRYTYR